MEGLLVHGSSDGCSAREKLGSHQLLPCSPTAAPGSVWGAGASLEGQGCPQCLLLALRCSSTEPWGAAMGPPCQSTRTSWATPSSWSPSSQCPQVSPSDSVPRPACGGIYLVSHGVSLRVPTPRPQPSLQKGRGTGDVRGAVPESPCPQGLNFALALPVYSASSRFFQPWGWIGAESAQCSPGTVPGVLGRDSHMCPLQPNTPAAFACPGDGMRRGSSQGTLGIPNGLSRPAGHKHQLFSVPARNMSQRILGL